MTPPITTPTAISAMSLGSWPARHPSMARNGALGGCSVLPAGNPWNQDVSGLPAAAGSAAYIGAIGASGHLHPDFGGGGAYGIPYVTVHAQPPVPVNFTAYGD